MLWGWEYIWWEGNTQIILRRADWSSSKCVAFVRQLLDYGQSSSDIHYNGQVTKTNLRHLLCLKVCGIGTIIFRKADLSSSKCVAFIRPLLDYGQSSADQMHRCNEVRQKITSQSCNRRKCWNRSLRMGKSSRHSQLSEIRKYPHHFSSNL